MVKNRKKLMISKIILIIAFTLAIFPYIWMFLSSMKNKSEIFSGTLLPSNINIDNYISVIKETPFLKYMENSMISSTIIVILQTTGAILAAYTFTRFSRKWINAIFLIIIGIYMLPSAVTYIPSYIILSKIGLMDSLTGWILSEAVSVFAIFFLTQMFKQVPEDIINAAKLDGAKHLKMIRHVFVPYNKNAIVSILIISFINSYNSYMWPALLIKSPNKMVMTVGLKKLFMQEAGYGTNWALVMAACTLAVLPIIIILAIGSKKLVNSISNMYTDK